MKLHTSSRSLSVSALSEPISLANPFLNVFISMCRLHLRKTWSGARLCTGIQEKEMGLLNKIDAAVLGVPKAGCTSLQRLLPPPAALPVQRGSCLQDLAGLGSSLAAGMASVRSVLDYSGENPENCPEHCFILHFCCVTECVTV